jgi:hypothetical protein
MNHFFGYVSEREIYLSLTESMEKAVRKFNLPREQWLLFLDRIQKPDLNRMWETFIKIGTSDAASFERLVHVIRFMIRPMISDLMQKRVINWYCFLIHDRHSGVPTSEDDNNAYFHIRFALEADVEPERVLDSLPDHCVMTRRVEPRLETISGIDKSLLKNEEIEEAWRIIGEQSQWLLNMLSIHKEEVEVQPQQIAQFLHFYANMTQLRIR